MANAPELIWTKVPEEAGGGYVAETADGYRAGVHHVDRRIDSYFAGIETPGWYYSGLFATMGTAKSWARKTIIADRRAPLQRPASA